MQSVKEDMEVKQSEKEAMVMKQNVKMDMDGMKQNVKEDMDVMGQNEEDMDGMKQNVGLYTSPQVECVAECRRLHATPAPGETDQERMSRLRRLRACFEACFPIWYGDPVQ